MYLANLKITKKEGSKPVSETHLVKADDLVRLESILKLKLSNFHLVSCKYINYTEIFETGEGNFFIVKLLADNMDGDIVKETFLQEAFDNDEARHKFRQSIDYGIITDIIQTNIHSILQL